MCVDNPREGFEDLFAPHPSVDRRVDALVRFAGGHDPGPIALAPPEPGAELSPADMPPQPWGPTPPVSGQTPQVGRPFLPNWPPPGRNGT
jgi:heat shock protein HtpX